MLVKNKLCKRIIPCLDVANGKTVKGVNFKDLREIGDPVELAAFYENEGADELTFLDISASVEERKTVVELVECVADKLSIPFTVGGGISSADDARKLLSSGADKVTVNTSAFQNPDLIGEIATAWGAQCCVVAIDARACTVQGKSYFEVLIKGGREATGADALAWARQCVERGAGEILLTSWDRDGTKSGFDIEMVRTFTDNLSVPVIASGGARDGNSFVDVFVKGNADAALAASVFHDRIYSVAQIKNQLRDAGVQVRI